MRRESMLEQRDRARRLATGIVSFAIMALGVTALVGAGLIAVRGGLPLIFLALMVGAVAVAIVFSGLFFHLLPSRIDALADEKREYDRREAAKAARANANANGDDVTRR